MWQILQQPYEPHTTLAALIFATMMSGYLTMVAGVVNKNVFGKFSRSTLINALVIGLVSGVVFCAGSGTVALLLLCPLFALLGACAVVAATKIVSRLLTKND
jgi:hypothetical protein